MPCEKEWGHLYSIHQKPIDRKSQRVRGPICTDLLKDETLPITLDSPILETPNYCGKSMMKKYYQSLENPPCQQVYRRYITH